MAWALTGLTRLAEAAAGQEKPAPGKPPGAGQPTADSPPEEPPEEDESAKPVVYELNPLQAETELKVGNFYFRKGSFRAAAKRFEEAGKWNPSLGEAFLRLGDAREKLNDSKGAAEAWAKYLEIEPEGKAAPAIRKKLKRK